MSCILVTGGCGYIGSHACVALLEADYQVVVVDNLSNGHAEALQRVEKICGRPIEAFYQGSVGDADLLNKIFGTHDITAVLHFAALKAVGESVLQPLNYYANNLSATLALCQAMRAHGIRQLVFSSSATVYGSGCSMPVREDAPCSATNPYGWSKLMCEQILRDVYASEPSWNVMLLRYFNPVGAHPSGLIGEDPHGIPNNLMPYVTQVAVGKLAQLNIFGNDYPTPDGTGVRDYIHVMDLVEGHVKALQAMKLHPGLHHINLGTGTGYSVLEMVKAMELSSGSAISYQFAPRRSGDVAACWADVKKAGELLGWRARYGLEAMCADAWRWQSHNPNGYRG